MWVLLYTIDVYLVSYVGYGNFLVPDIIYVYVSQWKWLSVTCTPSWRTARAPYWEVVVRGAYVCVLHIKPFFLLVHTRYGWHPRE